MIECKEALLDSEISLVKDFLAKQDLLLDKDIDIPLYVEENGKVVGTISKYKYIIKCVAIDPTYGMYEVCANVNDVEYRKVLLDDGFQFKADSMLGSADENTKLMFLCSPNNPTGNLLDRNEIIKLIEQFQGIVVLDEAYAEGKLSPELKAAYDRVKAGSTDPDDKEKSEAYEGYLENANLYWASNDLNFKELQKGMTQYYNKTGIKEKLLKYIAGDEKPLRDDSNIWTTALSITCNCTQKRLTARFWEHTDTILIWQF